MKNLLSIATTLLIGCALTLSACGKDKKPATNEPAAAEPAKTEPAKTEAPAAAGGEAKPAEPAKGGW
jgi:hypothetical protein